MTFEERLNQSENSLKKLDRDLWRTGIICSLIEILLVALMVFNISRDKYIWWVGLHGFLAGLSTTLFLFIIRGLQRTRSEQKTLLRRSKELRQRARSLDETFGKIQNELSTRFRNTKATKNAPHDTVN